MRDRSVMVNCLNVVMKDFLPITAKLDKEAVTTKAHPSLNMPSDSNFGLWVNMPKGTWDKINVTLLSNYLRSTQK